MARWRNKNPGMFIACFHDAMRDGEGEDKLVFVGVDHEVKQKQRDFQLFRFCLRNHPLHPLHKFEVGLAHRTKIRYNHQFDRWELLLTSRKLLTDMMEITENLGDSA